MIQFNHFNFNVLDLEKSLKFYKDTLNLEPVREKNAADGSFKLVYLGDSSSNFTLELTDFPDLLFIRNRNKIFSTAAHFQNFFTGQAL